jgi:hypothetical protein
MLSSKERFLFPSRESNPSRPVANHPDIIRTMKSRKLRWKEHIERVRETRNAYNVLGGTREGKSLLGRSMCR